MENKLANDSSPESRILLIENGKTDFISSNNIIIKEELIIQPDESMSIIQFSHIGNNNNNFTITDESARKKEENKIKKYSKRKKTQRSPDWWTVTLIYCPKCKTTRNKKCREKLKTCEDCFTAYWYQCGNCDRRYEKLSGVRDHINLRCNRKKYKSYENDILASKHSKNECSKCFKTFTQKNDRLEHEEHCTVDELGLKCGYCTYKARHKRYLRLHLRENHAELFKVRLQKYEAVMCAHCNYKAFKKYLLIDHIMDRHNPDKTHNSIQKPTNSVPIFPNINFIQPRYITIFPKMG